MMNNTFKVGEFNCEFPRHSRPGGRDPPGSCGASPTIWYFRARPIWAASRSSRTLKRGVRKPLKVGIREQMKATLLILPPAAEDADMVIVDDGGQTHEQAGTQPGPAAFERAGIKRLRAKATACIINAGPTDFDAGTLLVSWAATIGRCVLIETEVAEWADRARYVKAVNSDITAGLRVPSTEIVPADLVGTID